MDGYVGTLVRHTFSHRWTLGSLYLGDELECFTLEDADRFALGLPKVPDKTAIPTGTYPVTISWSPKFKRMMPLLLGVEDFDGVRIHPGNTDVDTAGCILTGMQLKEGRIIHSRKAYSVLRKKIEAAEKAGGFVLEIGRSWNLPKSMESKLRSLWSGQPVPPR